jgi:hypothetical protein
MEITISELQRFLDDPVWRIFKKELSYMNSNVVASILTQSELLEIYRAQGRSEVLSDIIRWPEMQLEQLESESKS